MPAFPSVEVWRQMTNVDDRLFGGIRSRSAEFNALDSAFESYAKARETKDSLGLSIAREYQNLKNAYEVYVAKKEANNSNWHLFGSTDSDEKFGALTSLKQFLSGYPTAELTPSEERACLNFTFEKAMRARTALAEAEIKLKEPKFFFTKASETLRSLKHLVLDSSREKKRRSRSSPRMHRAMRRPRSPRIFTIKPMRRLAQYRTPLVGGGSKQSQDSKRWFRKR